MYPYTPFSNNFAPIDPHFTPPDDPFNDSTTVPGTPHPHQQLQSTTNLFGESFVNNFVGLGQFVNGAAVAPFSGAQPDNGVGYFPVLVNQVPYYPVFNTPQTPQMMIPTQAPGMVIFF